MNRKERRQRKKQIQKLNNELRKSDGCFGSTPKIKSLNLHVIRESSRHHNWCNRLGVAHDPQ